MASTAWLWLMLLGAWEVGPVAASNRTDLKLFTPFRNVTVSAKKKMWLFPMQYVLCPRLCPHAVQFEREERAGPQKSLPCVPPPHGLRSFTSAIVVDHTAGPDGTEL